MSLRSAMAHRNLLYLLSLKELRTRYKKSILGWAWSLFNPLSQMLIFSVIFIYVFKQTPPIGDPSGLKNFPIYFLSGLLPFNFFAIGISVSIGAVQGGAGLIKKVQFPHEHLVFSVIVAQFVTLGIEISLLIVVLLIAGNFVLPWLLTLLIVLSFLALFTAGLALFLAAANVFYHDVNYLWGILSQILFYATPIIYDPTTLTFKPLKILASYGPTGGFIVALHNIVYDSRIPSAARLAEIAVLGVGTFFLGLWAFNRMSPRFAEEM